MEVLFKKSNAKLYSLVPCKGLPSGFSYLSGVSLINWAILLINNFLFFFISSFKIFPSSSTNYTLILPIIYNYINIYINLKIKEHIRI